MHKKDLLLIAILFCFSLSSYSQLCEGSLGDPIVEIDFGSGSNRGSSLGSAITAFTYSSTGELDEGEYTIANSTNGLKNSWHVIDDHTGNSNGYMMVINSAVIANEGVFYTKTVSGLCPNTTYEFSAWLINLLNPNTGLTDQYSPNVTFRISDTSGTVLGSYSTGNIGQTSSPTWLQYGFFFTSGNDAEVVISILNSAPSAHPGNDISLDDISFRPCGPTITTSIQNETSNNLSICEDETVSYTFESVISSGYSNPQYQWQISDNNGTTWNDILGEVSTNYIFFDTNTVGTFLYRMAVADGININSKTCRILSDEFNVEITAKPDPLIGDAEQGFCSTQNPTLNDIEVNATAIWYDAAINGNTLVETTALVDGTTYYATQINNGCESDDVLAVLVSIYSPTLEIYNIDDILCDNLNDGDEVIDLTVYEEKITTCADCIYNYFTSETDAKNFSSMGLIVAPHSFNWTSNVNTVYVRIDSTDKCYQISEISIVLQESPIIPLGDNIGICENENDVTIDAGFGFDSYLWSTNETTQSITISADKIGAQWVTVTEDHGTYICSSTKNFTVLLSNTAVINSIDIEDWTDNNNVITINLSDLSLGDYEYSLDKITYQDSNIFTNLNYGEHTVYVRDKNGCGTINEVVYLLNAPKFFTPNNDGYNDTWSIPFSETVEPTMTINIYDRYGKLIKFLNASAAWDGTINGNNMPTSDYWYVVTRASGRHYTGHFTLKR